MYNTRASWQGFNLLRQGHPSIRDRITALTTTIAGTGTLFCSAGALSPPGIELLTAAGLRVSPHRLVWTSREEYEAVLRDLAARGARLAFHNAHPPGEVPERLYWIPRDLLTELNDKACLPRLVPAEAHPPRRVVSMEEAQRLQIAPDTTLVIRGSTPRSTGAGGAVVMVRDQDMLSRLQLRLPGCDRVVVEEFQPFGRTLCVTWAVTHDGRIIYVGSADQIVDEEGVFHGSLMGPECEAPAEAIELGRRILTAAASRGYIGFAGIDMGLLPDGRILAFDLNFRLCASTPSLIWLNSFVRRSGARWCRLGTFTSCVPHAVMCARALSAVRAGWLLPLDTFDPVPAGWTGVGPTLRGLVAGRDRAEIEEHCGELARSGLTLV